MRNKKLFLAMALVLFFGACSDDEENIAMPELPDVDMDISIPEDTKTWKPGMEFSPYPGMPTEEKGEMVHVIVVDAEEHGRKIMEVLNNRAWAWAMNDDDRKNLKQCFFPIHKDIDLYLTEDYGFDNSEHRACNIISASISTDNYKVAQGSLQAYMNTDNYPEFPLIITSAGNGTNYFTQEAWDLVQEIGTLHWDDLVEHFGWKPDDAGNFEPWQTAWFKPGDVAAAYAIQDPDGYGHAKDYIVVGSDSGNGNKPGPILKERWICTYYTFDIEDSPTDGTSFSTPYVAKIAAEIMRRDSTLFE